MEIFMVIFISLFLLCLFMLKWNHIKYNTKGLPPGTMGWPFFGETYEFLNQGPQFLKSKRSRYGNVFKSHILGSPTVISMDPELNRYILLNEAKGLVPGYPQSMLDILGKRNISAVRGATHKCMRGNIMSLVGPQVVKNDRLLARINTYMRIHLSNWDDKTVDLQAKTLEMQIFIALKLIAEKESSSVYESFKSEFDKLLIGSLSLPVNLPGTNYYRGYKGRENVIKILKDIVDKRMVSRVTHDDMLELLLRGDQDVKYKLDDEEIIDQIITILYSGYETVSTTSMMVLKYLNENPQALQELRDEIFEIREGKTADQHLDWDDYRSMRFTRAVIYETLRLANVVNGEMWKTTQELELNGFVIPEGWRIYVYTREINYDPFLYPEPLKFNPWRWMDVGLESHNYCMLFGAGGRLCPGKEMGIVIVSTFLHYFVTSYRWEEVGGDEILEFPRVEAPKGYHIRVMKF